MRSVAIVPTLVIGLVWPLASTAYTFPKRQLTFGERTENSLAMSGSVAGWVSCARDPIEGESDPPTCDIEIFDANVGGLGFRSVPPVGPTVVFRRDVGAESQIFYAPEPGAGAIAAALVALGVLRRRTTGS